MRVLIKQYVASLRERRELDVLLPDLLSELGFQVYSRPGIGTRQFGVDVAAVGSDTDGARKVFLFSIKAGDVTRADWDDTNQGLRRSLNEITDHYIPNYIPPRYRSLPIIICPTFGGDVDENVRPLINGFIQNETERHRARQITYDEWDGDKLTTYIGQAFLNEELMPSALRAHLRKALAMVDEPDSAVLHFTELLKSIAEQKRANPKATLTAARQVNICMWILFAWAQDAGNLDAPQRAGEIATLCVWELAKDVLASGRNTKISRALNQVVVSVMNTQATISAAYFEKLSKAAHTFHGLGSVVRTASSVEINLKLFDFVGRLAVHALWLHHFWSVTPDKTSEAGRQARARVVVARDMLMAAIQNNPALNTPLIDDQAFDINLACLFLQSVGEIGAVSQWVGDITRAVIFAFLRHDRYPSRLASYRALLKHPEKRTDEYRKKITQASILFPTLAVWAGINSDHTTTNYLGEFAEKSLDHCNMQVLLPDEDSESVLFLIENKPHGLILDDLKISRDGLQPIQKIREEVAEVDHLGALIPTRFGLHVLTLMACRYHRIPSPPQYWLQFAARSEEIAAAPKSALPPGD